MSNISKVWRRFSKRIDGRNVSFRWEQLPKRRFEEFLDFIMEYYVKQEFTHTLAGLHTNSAALKEYRKMAMELYTCPSYHNAICCVDDNTNKMVAFDSLKMYRRGHMLNKVHSFKPETAEMQKFCEILRNWDNRCPVSRVMERYGVTTYFDDRGTAVQPDYRGRHMLTEIALLRHAVTKASKVPLTGAWMTSNSVQNTTSRHGWDTVYEISSEDLEKILGLELPRPSQMFRYNV